MAYHIDYTLPRSQNVMQRILGRIIDLSAVGRKDTNRRIGAKNIEKAIGREIGYPLGINGTYKGNRPGSHSTYKILMQLRSGDRSRIDRKHVADNLLQK